MREYSAVFALKKSIQYYRLDHYFRRGLLISGAFTVGGALLWELLEGNVLK